MGRTSDYTKQVRNEECENTVESHKSCSNIFFYDRIYSVIIPSWNISNIGSDL